LFARKTVFVIGAGCSAEYGLPVGDGLRDEIAKRLRSLDGLLRDSAVRQDTGLNDALTRVGKCDLGSWCALAGKMAQGIQHTSSIDRYLNLRQDDERIVILGKLLIARAVLAAEAGSTLVVKGRAGIDHVKVKSLVADSGGYHWLGRLFDQMQEGVSNRAQLSQVFENVSFVCFNYDRCIEHYFFHALQELGSLSDAEASEAMKALVIEHPYGRVGHLPWEAAPPGAHKVEFGKQADYGEELNVVAAGIKTFTERVEEGDALARTRGLIADAAQVVFMGFSFLDQNMALLTPPTGSAAESAFATTYGESRPNESLYQTMMQQCLARASSQKPSVSVSMDSNKAGYFLHEWGNRLRR
jgi:hypothetical protein